MPWCTEKTLMEQYFLYHCLSHPCTWKVPQHLITVSLDRLISTSKSDYGQIKIKLRSNQEQMSEKDNKVLPLLCHPRLIIRARLISRWLVDPSMHNFSARSSLSIKRWRNFASNFSVNLPSDFNFLADFFLSFAISCLKMHGLSVWSATYRIKLKKIWLWFIMNPIELSLFTGRVLV